jgi:uncharacterized repeat protein (TIGR01451 family)
VSVSDFDDTQVLLVKPLIQVIKTDSNLNDLDNVQGNDTQTVQEGDSAIFAITVQNNGTEDLKTVILTDPKSASCNRTDAQTKALIKLIGNKDEIFNVGESFSYTCEKTNTQIDYTNIIDVS